MTDWEKEKVGHITISKVTCNRSEHPWVKIEAKLGKKLFIIELGMEDFGRAFMGQARIPCSITKRIIGRA